MKPCSVDGCVYPRKYKLYCSMHYQRVNDGKPLGGPHRQRAEHGAGHIGRAGYREFDAGAEHTLVVERVLGRTLPVGAVVHHVNGDKLDNRPQNLVVCPDQGYHAMLHARHRAYDECGHAGWLKCIYCKRYDDPVNMRVRTDKRQAQHRACEAKYKRDKRVSSAGTV